MYCGESPKNIWEKFSKIKANRVKKKSTKKLTKFSIKEMNSAFHQIIKGMLKLQWMDANEKLFSEIDDLGKFGMIS